MGAKTWDLRHAATRDAVQRLLDSPEVAEVHLCKSLRAEDPVSVGVRRLPDMRMRWSYGPTPWQTLTLAEESLRPRTLVEET